MRISTLGRALLAGPVLLAALGTLSACAPQYDPLYRDGLWEPTHVNRNNLVLMVANPTDLVRGSGRATSDGQLAAAAVERLRQEKVKKLPASDIASVGGGGENNGTPGGAGSSGSP